MALIIAFTNHKGGVAKTSSVGALASIYAREGSRVLMVDLDTQANLTYSFIDMVKAPPARFIYDAIRDRRDLPQVAVRDNLYIVPSGLYMTIVEAEMHNMRRREYILQDLVWPVEKNYDLIFLDCPPALNIITDNALVIADRLTVPMNADQFSYNGLGMMKGYLDRIRDLNEKIRIDDIFFTRYSAATKLARATREQVEKEYPEETMKTVIRPTVRVQEAVSYCQSVVDYAPDCSAARDYEALAVEYAGRLIKCSN